MKTAKEHIEEGEKEFWEKFPRLVISINPSVIGYRDERVETDGQIMKNYISESLLSTLAYLKERMPKEKIKSKLTTHEQTWYMVDGFNSALTLCLAPIEELELEIKKRMR